MKTAFSFITIFLALAPTTESTDKQQLRRQTKKGKGKDKGKEPELFLPATW
jgi:hypothetical protein